MDAGRDARDARDAPGAPMHPRTRARAGTAESRVRGRVEPPRNPRGDMSREQRLRELSEATLPGAIQDLGEKEMNVSKVISYCEQAYVSQDKREILRQTIEYMEDALGAITQDVELIASEMAGFVDLQSEMLAELTEKTNAVKNAMQVVRAQRGLERLGEECAKEIVDPRVSHQQMVKEEQRPQELPAPAVQP